MFSGKINGYNYEIEENRIIWFKADQMAEKLGLIGTRNNRRGKTFIRWNTFNNMINGTTSCATVPTSGDNSISIDCGSKGSIAISFPVKSGDYIPYPLVLRIAMRLNNDTAREFQLKLIDIVDSINEDGIYTGNGLIDIGTDVTKENPAAGSTRDIINNTVQGYSRFAKVTKGQAYNKLYQTVENMYGINIPTRKNNYAKKNEVKNYTGTQYIKDNNMENKVGMALACMLYNQANLRTLGVPSPIEISANQQQPITVINNINQQPVDDGYYHPNLKIIAEVTRTANGVKTTCQTLQDDTGKRYFNTKKENI